MDEQTRQLIAAYHDGELDQARCAEVERLVQSHAEAAAELADLRELTAALQRVCRPRMDRDLLAAVHQQIEHNAGDPVIYRITRWASAAAAAIILVCGSALMTQTAVSGANLESDPLAEGFALLNSPVNSSSDPVEPAPEVQLSQWIVAELAAGEGSATP